MLNIHNSDLISSWELKVEARGPQSSFYNYVFSQRMRKVITWELAAVMREGNSTYYHAPTMHVLHVALQLHGPVTKKIVRPRKIILGQKVAMKFAPINVRPCQILSREGSHHDDGVQKAVARPSGCETSKWIASECVEKILWSRHVST